jgi:hypothetical protein
MGGFVEGCQFRCFGGCIAVLQGIWDGRPMQLVVVIVDGEKDVWQYHLLALFFNLLHSLITRQRDQVEVKITSSL